MEKKRGMAYPDFLAEMADTIAKGLQEECGVSQDLATDQAFKVTERIRKNFGGESIYLPKCVHLECSLRDLEILKKCKYMLYGDVAKEYGVSLRRIYQIMFQAKFGQASAQPFLPMGDHSEDDDKQTDDVRDEPTEMY